MQIIVAVLFLAHGVGHVLFLANSWGLWKGATGRAAFFENVLHASPTVEWIAGIFWVIPLVGFVATAWGFYSDAAWWRTAALASAVVSAALIVVWWNGLTASSTIFALIFNIAVVAILLYQQSTGAASPAS